MKKLFIPIKIKGTNSVSINPVSLTIDVAVRVGNEFYVALFQIYNRKMYYLLDLFRQHLIENFQNLSQSQYFFGTDLSRIHFLLKKFIEERAYLNDYVEFVNRNKI